MVVCAVVGACMPDYDFVPDKQLASHCSNGEIDDASGETGIDCGGPDCDRCGLGEACSTASDCQQGDCLLGYCQEPGCMDGVKNGLETGKDCGSGCMPCQDGEACVAPTDCLSKSCKDEHCATPTCDDGVLNGDEPTRDCGGSICDGCAVGAHCNVDTDCLSSACDTGTHKCVLNCTPNTDDCDGDTSVECETNLLTSARNCGMCGHQCELPHASVMCVGGACQIDKCTSPWERCDTDETNGCETNLSTDAKNCGGCGMECPEVHGTAQCVQGKCAVDECEDGYGDCDMDASNGCEASVTDVQNCGQCGEKCSAPDGAEPYCTAKDGCGYTDCMAGRGNCAGDSSGECANDLTTDVDNCGRCGHVCSVANGTPRCEAGECVIDSCNDGWDNCNSGDPDGGYSDGCEINTYQSPDNCGACGKSCDVSHGEGTCEYGTCAVVSCGTGYKNCDVTAADGGVGNGCETNTTNDKSNCGGCGNVCTGTHAVLGCVDSTCVPTGCEKNWDDCTAAEGCETDTSSNILHCGSCEGTCSKAGATAATCSGGACAAPTCDTTHLNCDGNNANGCEATLGTAASCNACPAQGGACTTALPNCVLSGTTYHCQADVTVGPTAQGNAVAATLNVTHALAAGSNRLVLVAVVGKSDSNDPTNGGIVQGRPDTVTYGGVAMTKLGELAPPNFNAANLYLYYLTDTGSKRLPTGAGSQTLAIDGTKHVLRPLIYVANVVQFNGVSQTTPLVAGGTATTGTGAVSISAATNVAISGSVVYTAVSAQYVSGWKAPLDTDLVSTLTMSQNVSSNTVVAYGGVTPPRSAGTVTIAWTWNYAPAMSAEYSVMVQPASN